MTSLEQFVATSNIAHLERRLTEVETGSARHAQIAELLAAAKAELLKISPIEIGRPDDGSQDPDDPFNPDGN